MKYISLTEEASNVIIERLRTKLSGKGIPEKLTFEINPSVKLKIEEKAHIFFENKAWGKMQALIRQCEKEIGFYGFVDRSDDGLHFTISDILVCPQTVTGATVTTDDKEYIKWHEEMFDKYGEDYLTKKRFYGHSHVNMGVTPSATDNQHHDDLLQTTKDFYIFGIFNKRGEAWFNIFDVEYNLLYEKDDIICEHDSEYEDWASEQIAEKVKEHVFAPSIENRTGWKGGTNWHNPYYPRDYDRFYDDDEEDAFAEYFNRGKTRRSYSSQGKGR